MRRRRNVGGLVAAIILGTIALSILCSSLYQNFVLRSHFNGVFTMMQSKKFVKMQDIYGDQPVDNAYLKVMAKYTLLGWKYTEITGQPWPLDKTSDMNTVSAELYYKDLPDSMIAPKGKYKQIDHPKYGPCSVVPVKVEFKYTWDKPMNKWFIPRPNYADGQNWLGPFEKIH